MLEYSVISTILQSPLVSLSDSSSTITSFLESEGIKHNVSVVVM